MGRVLRPHGLRGEVVVELFTDRTERLLSGSELFAEERRLEVAAARPHQGRWIVSFVGVANRDAADGLRGPLCAPALDDPEALWVHELIGAAVVTIDGRVCGGVAAVRENPAGDVLELDGGVLVPVVFVVGWDDAEPPRLVIDPPEGLLDL